MHFFLRSPNIWHGNDNYLFYQIVQNLLFLHEQLVIPFIVRQFFPRNKPIVSDALDPFVGELGSIMVTVAGNNLSWIRIPQ